MKAVRFITKKLLSIDREFARRRRKRNAARVLAKWAKPYRLNIGCGAAGFEGWLNLDLCEQPGVDLAWDITDGLPLEENTCEFIYNEHFLEHFSVEQGLKILRECHRVLQPGGVLRVAMPHVAESVRRYHENDWRTAPWLEKFGYTWIETRAEMINVVFRHWGHQWLYDEEELSRRLREAGFRAIAPKPHGESDYAELRNRETREESRLVIEATKMSSAAPTRFPPLAR